MTKWIIALLLSGCSSLLYYPSPQLFYDPARLGLKPEEVHFPSANGEQLFGWYFRHKGKEPAKAIVVFYHGNAENLSSHYLNVAWLVDYPFDLFVFDYQGYGRSKGSPSPQKTVEDGAAALAWAHQKSPELPLVIFGQSLGGVVALRNAIDLKDKLPIRLVAVDSTFLSYRTMARRVMSRAWLTWPFQWLGWLSLSDRYAPKGEVGKIAPLPLLVIHGDKDGVVDFDQGQRVFNEALEPKEFWHIPEGTHTSVFSDKAYQKKFAAWVEEKLRKK